MKGAWAEHLLHGSATIRWPMDHNRGPDYAVIHMLLIRDRNFDKSEQTLAKLPLKKRMKELYIREYRNNAMTLCPVT